MTPDPQEELEELRETHTPRPDVSGLQLPKRYHLPSGAKLTTAHSMKLLDKRAEELSSALKQAQQELERPASPPPQPDPFIYQPKKVHG